MDRTYFLDAVRQPCDDKTRLTIAILPRRYNQYPHETEERLFKTFDNVFARIIGYENIT